MRLDVERLRTMDEVRDFMAGSEPVGFHLTDRRGALRFREMHSGAAGLQRVDQGAQGGRASLCGEGHGIVQGRRRRGGSLGTTRPGASRTIAAGRRARSSGAIRAADIALLAEVAETLGGLCAPATRRVTWRQYEVFGDERFERLARPSNRHL